MRPHEVLLFPFVTEKTLNLLSGTAAQNSTDGNRIQFVVRRTATKTEIREAFETLFEVKVEKVFTFIRKDGKHAIIKLKPGLSAEDIGMRIGVF